MAQSVSRRTLGLAGLGSVFAVLTGLMLAAPAAALPDYAVKTGQPCATCHVNPAGGGPRTDRGKAFEAIPTRFGDPAGAFAESAAVDSAPTPVDAPAADPAPAEPPAVEPAPVADAVSDCPEGLGEAQTAADGGECRQGEPGLALGGDAEVPADSSGS